MQIFPPTRRPTVDLVVFGDGPTEMVPIARRTLRETFGVVPGVRRVEPPDRQAEAVANPVTGEEGCFPVEPLLDAATAASEADREIGLVAKPLVMERTPDIFGVALVGDTTALITADPLTGDDDRFESRVEKQVTKQFVRLFGIEAVHEGCVLEETSTVFGLDETSPTLCESCRERLTAPQTSPQPPHWLVRDAPTFLARLGEEEKRTEPSSIPETGPSEPDPSQVTTSGSALPAGVRRHVHGFYRFVRFWSLVLGFLGFTVLALSTELRLYGRAFGTEPPVEAIWAMLVGAVLVGYYGQRTARRLIARVRSRRGGSGRS